MGDDWPFAVLDEGCCPLVQIYFGGKLSYCSYVLYELGRSFCPEDDTAPASLGRAVLRHLLGDWGAQVCSSHSVFNYP